MTGLGTFAHGQEVPGVPRKVLLFLDSEETLLNPDENENEKTICKIWFFWWISFGVIKKFEIFSKRTDAILFSYLIFPGKSLISCYGASVLNENSERENNLLLSLLFEEC